MNILIVEDEDVMREALVEQLANIGIKNVLQAKSVDSAISILESNDVQLIIADYTMPGKHGGDLLRWVHEKNLETMFVIFTASLKVDLPKTNKNFLGIIEKPNIVRLTDLIECSLFKP